MEGQAAAAGQLAPAFAIRVRLNSIDRLFDALDPSPLVERDLDGTVAEYIIDCAREAPQGVAFHLILHLPQAEAATTKPQALAGPICGYFDYLAERQMRRIRALLHDGRQALAMGIAFLVTCTLLGQLAVSLAGPTLGALLREGLLIIGWVANWRPVEIFLYEWRPRRRELRIYRALARLSVEIETDGQA
jgi:hypothetical protein